MFVSRACCTGSGMPVTLASESLVDRVQWVGVTGPPSSPLRSRMAHEPRVASPDETAVFEVRSRCGEHARVTSMSARTEAEARLVAELAHEDEHRAGGPLYEVESVGLLREAARPTDTPRPVLDWLRAQIGLSRWDG